MDHLLLLGLDGPGLLGPRQDELKLLLGDQRGAPGLQAEEAEKPARNEAEEAPDGIKEDGEAVNGPCGQPGDGLRVVDGEGLGGDLAEEEDEEGHRPRGHPHARGAEGLGGELRDQGSGGDVHQVVAHEDGGEEAGDVLGKEAEGTVFALGELLQLPRVEGGDGRLACGEEGGKGKEENEDRPKPRVFRGSHLALRQSRGTEGQKKKPPTRRTIHTSFAILHQARRHVPQRVSRGPRPGIPRGETQARTRRAEVVLTK